MKKEKHWFKFYPDKWMGDIELRTCTPMARALLIDLMAISFPNGIFDLKQREEKKQFIRQIGYTPIKFERSLNELLNKTRIVLDEKLDKYYIPKMRKDHEEYEIAQQNGKKGGNPNVLGVNPPLNPTLNPEVEVEEEKEKKKKEREDFLSKVDEVLKSLRIKTGKPFRTSTESSQTLLRARFNDGHSVYDCKRVIWSKCREWKDDPKMSGQLKPAVLFRKSNFEKYFDCLPVEKPSPPQPEQPDYVVQFND